MSQVKLSENAIADIKRLYDFLAQFDLTVADNSSLAIIQTLKSLAHQPMLGSPLKSKPSIRKIVVKFGASGYLIFHKRYANLDANLVIRVLHQKEWYDAKTIDLIDV
jgi:plasmid stabilization system protein ParE